MVQTATGPSAPISKNMIMELNFAI